MKILRQSIPGQAKDCSRSTTVIPPSLLHSLERFFRAELSRVRLRAGSPLPLSVGAQAVAWNDQIWLADPEPDFSSRATVRVLTHELAHICQQRAAPARQAFPVRIGDANDPLEAEADACARAFLLGRRCPELTADPAPALRRVLSIVPGSAKIPVIDFGRARPDIDLRLNGGGVVCHLTNGYTDRNTISDALFWQGEAAVRSGVSDPAELRSLRFGFIQFMRIDALICTYLGQNPAAGEISVNAFGAVTRRLNLDSAAPFTPFMSEIELPVSRGIARATAGDHPALKAPAQLLNRATQANNFLWEVLDRRRFWTVLTAQERATGAFRYLANHSWDLVYRFQLIWSGGKPQRFANSSLLTRVDLVTAGPPSDPDLAALLSAPRSPFANDVIQQAMVAAALAGPPTRVDSTTRLTQAPPNFYT
jgi:hypothetical protein